jgi:hypothetical protein
MSLPDDYEIVKITSSVASVKIYIPWSFDGVDELYVWYQNSVTGVVYYSENGDFTVTQDSDGGGVFILVENTESDPIDISIARETPKTQTYSLNEAEALNPVSLIEALDKMVKLLQEIALGYDDQFISSVNPFVIADKITRAGKLLKFDDNGDVDYGTVSGEIDAAIGYAEEWANKAEDELVSLGAGGDQIDDYSALHHAAKAAASAAAALASANNASTSASNASTSESNAAASAVSAAAEAKPMSATYLYDDTLTDADPGSGNIRFNSATLASITEAYIDDEDSSANDKQGLFSNLSEGYTLYVEQSSDVNNSALFSIGTITDNAGYTKLALTLKKSTGSLPVAGSNLVISIFPGASGGGGFPSTDEDKTVAYTVVSGDVGNNIVFSGLSANVDCTLDVSLLSLGDQLGVINEDPTYSVRVIVSNTGTMTIATGTSFYLWEQETVLLGGNTATNARILARP